MSHSVALTLEVSGATAGIVFPFILGVALIGVTFWLWSLIDILSWPRQTWDVAGLNRSRWVVRVTLLGAIGAVLYLRAARQQLKEAYTILRWGD